MVTYFTSMAALQLPSNSARLFVVMGVAGCGKSTVGQAWAEAIGAEFLDGDSYHPPANIEKMSRSEPLDDNDRWPWLDRFAQAMATSDGLVVGACSALKREYRRRISQASGESVCYIYLEGDPDLIGRRIAARDDHFMPADMLTSQLAILEPPGRDENAIRVDISGSTDDIIASIQSKLLKEPL